MSRKKSKKTLKRVLVNLIALSTALLCSLLYYNNLTENVGYIVYFGIFAITAHNLKDYINSGFYAIINDTMERASVYLDMEGMKHYSEKIDDRYTAITITVLFLSIFLEAVHILRYRQSSL